MLKLNANIVVIINQKLNIKNLLQRRNHNCHKPVPVALSGEISLSPVSPEHEMVPNRGFPPV